MRRSKKFTIILEKGTLYSKIILVNKLQSYRAGGHANLGEDSIQKERNWRNKENHLNFKTSDQQTRRSFLKNSFSTFFLQ